MRVEVADNRFTQTGQVVGMLARLGFRIAHPARSILSLARVGAVRMYTKRLKNRRRLKTARGARFEGCNGEHARWNTYTRVFACITGRTFTKRRYRGERGRFR